MSTFLEEIAYQLHSQYADELKNCIFIFPNQRASANFYHLLIAQYRLQISKQNIWALDDWIIQASHLIVKDKLPLVVQLYQAFQQLQPTHESFESFYPWGSMLLQDFDIIDKCLINIDQLFLNLYEQKSLAPNYEHLSQDQRIALESFWGSFKHRLSTHQKTLLAFFQIIPQIYKHFTQALLSQKIAYTGLCYRYLLDHLSQNLLQGHTNMFVIGFNALHPAEEKLLAWLHAHISTHFFWDVDAYYMEDTHQEAGTALRQYQKKEYFQNSFPTTLPAFIQHNKKEIILLEAAGQTEEVYATSKALQAIIQQAGESFSTNQVAIIIGDESFLLPMLYALPPAIKVQSTLGYPIAHTSIYQLINQLFNLWQAAQKIDNALQQLPIQFVISILNNPLVNNYDEEMAAKLLHTLHQSSCSTIDIELLLKEINYKVNPLYHQIFSRLPATQESSITYLLDILASFDDKSLANMPALEQQALAQLKDRINELNTYIGPLSYNLTFDRFIVLFGHCIKPLRLNPSLSEGHEAGIKLMRIWETSCLDFKYVFILGLNEGNLPTNNYQQQSFIPYNLRKGYGLPTHDTFQAILDAYYFYRLFQRSAYVHMTYSSKVILGNQQEMSRYGWQLCYESGLPIERRYMHDQPPVSIPPPIVIQKTPMIMAKLACYTVQSALDNTGILTPAALNTYLDCSLRFYFHYLLNLKGLPKKISEEPSSVCFGTMFHEVMEKVYMPFVGHLIQVEDLQRLKKNSSACIETIFIKHFYGSQHATNSLQGQLLIEQTVMEKIVHQLLEVDESYAPFQLVVLEWGKEKKNYIHHKVNEKLVMRLGGIIDRVDKKGNVFRVIDYKTGMDEKYAKNMHDLFLSNHPKRSKAFLQTFFYAWLFKKKQGIENREVVITPSIINTKAIFKPDFDARLVFKDEKKTSHYLDNISEYESDFESELNRLLLDIMDPNIPFVQTENVTVCTTCPYKGVCQRY